MHIYTLSSLLLWECTTNIARFRLFEEKTLSRRACAANQTQNGTVALLI